MQRSYHLNITASDQGSPSLLSSIAFLVTVEDDNDNAPAFPKVCPVYSALPFIASFFLISFFFVFSQHGHRPADPGRHPLEHAHRDGDGDGRGSRFGYQQPHQLIAPVQRQGVAERHDLV